MEATGERTDKVGASAKDVDGVLPDLRRCSRVGRGRRSSRESREGS